MFLPWREAWDAHTGVFAEVQVDLNKALPSQAGIRGPYVNTGSKDVGPDPNFGKK